MLASLFSLLFSTPPLLFLYLPCFFLRFSFGVFRRVVVVIFSFNLIIIASRGRKTERTKWTRAFQEEITTKRKNHTERVKERKTQRTKNHEKETKKQKPEERRKTRERQNEQKQRGGEKDCSTRHDRLTSSSPAKIPPDEFFFPCLQL